MVVKTCATCVHEHKEPYDHPCCKCKTKCIEEYWEAKEAEEMMPDGS